MISEIDIKDWDRDEFLAVCDAMSEEEKTVTFEQQGDEAIMKLDVLLVNYGKALRAHREQQQKVLNEAARKAYKLPPSPTVDPRQMDLSDVFPMEFEIPSIWKAK